MPRQNFHSSGVFTYIEYRLKIVFIVWFGSHQEYEKVNIKTLTYGNQGYETGEKMELLAILIEKYERSNFSISPPDPVDAILFRMEQMNLKQKDLASFFGGKTKISEVLNRKRPLSLRTIALLHENLGIPLESMVRTKQAHQGVNLF